MGEYYKDKHAKEREGDRWVIQVVVYHDFDYERYKNDCDCREGSIWAKKNVDEGVFILDWIEEKDKHLV